jgi:hypothetical protein
VELRDNFEAMRYIRIHINIHGYLRSPSKILLLPEQGLQTSASAALNSRRVHVLGYLEQARGGSGWI